MGAKSERSLNGTQISSFLMRTVPGLTGGRSNGMVVANRL